MKTEYIKNWLKVKGQVFCAIIGILLTAFLLKYILGFPYIIYKHLNIGNWGVIIGSLILFILVNIPIGIVSVYSELDEGDIRILELISLICLLIISLFTFFYINYNTAYTPYLT